MLNDLGNWLAEILHSFLAGIVGAIIRWLMRIIKYAILSFAAGAIAAAGLSAGVLYSQTRAAPTHANWLIIGVIAVLAGALVATITVMLHMIAAMFRLARHPFGGSHTPHGPQPPTGTDPGRAMPDNIRRFRQRSNHRSRAS